MLDYLGEVQSSDVARAEAKLERPKSDIEARLLAQARRILSSKVLPPGHGKRRAAPSRQLRSHTRFKSRPLSSDGHRQYGFTLARGLLHSYTWQWPVWHRSLMRDG